MSAIRWRKNERARFSQPHAFTPTEPGLYHITATITWAPPRRAANGPTLARSRLRRRGR